MTVEAAPLVLPAAPASIPAARRHVTALCRAHGLPQDVVEGAALVTSELVTNAVLHGRSPVALTATVGGAVLRVEVGDDNSRVPVLQEEDAAALDGRGLHIVDALADRWGVADRDVGKAVWFELDLPRSSAGGGGP